MVQDKLRVPAETFATQRGISVSAVVHRIRAGIYDGLEEDGQFFVLRDPPPRAASRPAPRKQDKPTRPVRESSPISNAIIFGGLAICLGGMFLDIPEPLAPLFVGLVSLMFATLAHDALRTGRTMWNAGTMTEADNPAAFWFKVGFYCFMSLLALIAAVVVAYSTYFS